MYYDETPGHSPKGHRLPVGVDVEVAPSGYMGRPVWYGTLKAHLYWGDGEYTRLVVVSCTNAGDFPLYQQVGRGYQVEIRRCAVVES